jgi:hypothetical protein
MAKIIQTTLPSKKISTVDVAEILNFKAEFVYNFFQKDERRNETGEGVLERFKTLNATDLPTSIQESVDINTRVPRYILLSWNPYVVGSNSEISNNVRIKDNIDKVYFEDDFSYDDFSVLEIQDLSVDRKLNLFVETLLKNSSKESKNISAVNAIRSATEATNTSVRPEILANGMDAKLFGLRFFGDNNKQKNSNDYANILKSNKSNIQLNNKILNDTIKYNAYIDPTNPFVDELQGFVSEASRIQKQARQDRDSSRISSEEYDFEIDKYIRQQVLFSDVHNPFIQSVGYLIEKIELLQDGTERKLQNIFVESPNKGAFFDPKVKYGATYIYKIRAVFYIEIEGIDENSGLLSSIGILVASRPSLTEAILCEEYAPPPAPQDLAFKYLPFDGVLKLTWAFPVNPQRDIKKFQVFRRFSIYEPYELLKEYDFDDSEVKVLSGEFPEEFLVEKLTGPKTMYLDHEFTRNSVAYYALASIDAHGITSNYSAQYKISFNNILNKLNVELLSIAGAPKAYPNIWINQDAFVDSIRDQYHSKLDVYFNPEYLKVFNKDDKDLNLLALKVSDCYQLQLINIDKNEQQILKIRLQDRTENVMREPIDGAINRTLLKQKLNTERLKNINADQERQESGYIDKKIDSVFKNQ